MGWVLMVFPITCAMQDDNPPPPEVIQFLSESRKNCIQILKTMRHTSPCDSMLEAIQSQLTSMSLAASACNLLFYESSELRITREIDNALEELLKVKFNLNLNENLAVNPNLLANAYYCILNVIKGIDKIE